MDKINLAAQQRFDLIDMTRLQTNIENYINKIHQRIFGDDLLYTGAAASKNRKPFIIWNFNIAKVGSPSLTIRTTRVDTTPATGYEAYIHDSNGHRMGGPNSAAYKDIIVAAAPGATPRYLHARHLETTGTPESRTFYDTASGKTKSTVNTEVVDDWELQESTTSADTDATLAAAGWINIATFQTNGTTDITVLTAKDKTFDRDLFTWPAGSRPANETLTSLLQQVAGLRQIVEEMRAGTVSRLWNDKPSNDACLNEEGGLTFGSGDTLDSGRLDRHTKVMTDTLCVGNDEKMAAFAGLSHIRGNTVYAQAANASGFRYTNSVPGSEVNTAMEKYWPVSAYDGFPATNNSNNDIYVGSTLDWSISDATAGLQGWFYPINTGAGAHAGQALRFPVRIPMHSRLYTVYVDFKEDTLDVDHFVEIGLWRRHVTSGALTLLAPTILGTGITTGTAGRIRYLSNWASWPGTGNFYYWTYSLVANYDFDSTDYLHYVDVIYGSVAAVSITSSPAWLHNIRLRTYITEASHVYDLIS